MLCLVLSNIKIDADYKYVKFSGNSVKIYTLKIMGIPLNYEYVCIYSLMKNIIIGTLISILYLDKTVSINFKHIQLGCYNHPTLQILFL